MKVKLSLSTSMYYKNLRCWKLYCISILPWGAGPPCAGCATAPWWRAPCWPACSSSRASPAAGTGRWGARSWSTSRCWLWLQSVDIKYKWKTPQFSALQCHVSDCLCSQCGDSNFEMNWPRKRCGSTKSASRDPVILILYGRIIRNMIAKL